MKGRRRFEAPAFWAVLFACAAHAVAQTPLGREELAHAFREGYQEPPVVACDGEAYCALVTSMGAPLETGVWHRRFARVVAPDGQLVAERELHINEGPQIWTGAIGLERGFAIFWDRVYPRGTFDAEYVVLALQLFDQALMPMSPVIEFLRRPSESGPRILGPIAVARTDTGYALLLSGLDPPNCALCDIRLFLMTIAPTGAVLHGPEGVNEDTQGIVQATTEGLAVDRDGNIIVVFDARTEEVSNARDVYLRRFSPRGEPLEPQVRVNTYLPDDQSLAAVAASPRGGYLVVWQSELQDGDHEGIYAQRFRANGRPVGGEFRANVDTRSAQRWPHVAVDRHGHYAVAWSSFWGDEFWDAYLRLFAPNASPLTSEVRVNENSWGAIGAGSLAVAPNDTLLVSTAHWTFDDVDLTDWYSRRFVASPGSEICVAQPNAWDCGFGPRRNQRLRVASPWGAGETPLLGDVDGDGRDDPCVFAGWTLRCDLDHGGRPAEHVAKFSGPLARAPLLADLDGDGHAELCLRTANVLNCASALSGGRLRPTGQFGKARDRIVAGDVDGNGRDDICAFRGGIFRCDTGHDGGGAEIVIRFGAAGDDPLLADVDGDFLDDPCVRRGQRLLCDVAHTDGEPDCVILLRGRNGVLLAGKLDGI